MRNIENSNGISALYISPCAPDLFTPSCLCAFDCRLHFRAARIRRKNVANLLKFLVELSLSQRWQAIASGPIRANIRITKEIGFFTHIGTSEHWNSVHRPHRSACVLSSRRNGRAYAAWRKRKQWDWTRCLCIVGTTRRVVHSHNNWTYVWYFVNINPNTI